MLTTDQINDLHRLYWSEHWPIRKIERQLNMGWKTIQKYLVAPAQSAAQRDRPSKLDPFKDIITEWLEKDPRVTAAVVEQKLRSLGYQGGHSIVRESKKRKPGWTIRSPNTPGKRAAIPRRPDPAKGDPAFIRCERWLWTALDFWMLILVFGQ
jgi:hypothetical protein